MGLGWGPAAVAAAAVASAAAGLTIYYVAFLLILFSRMSGSGLSEVIGRTAGDESLLAVALATKRFLISQPCDVTRGSDHFLSPRCS